MKAAPFRYERPRTLAEALELLRDSEHKALAGGQSLVPMMAFRLARPSVLIDLNRLSGLSAVRADNGRVRVGAMLLRTLHRHRRDTRGLEDGGSFLGSPRPRPGREPLVESGAVGKAALDGR